MPVLSDEQISYLEEIKNEGGCHASNILAKKNKSDIEKFINQYLEFSNNIGGTLDDAVVALNQYKDYIDKHNVFSAQSKFAPTIIEEFICRILKKEFGNDVLQYGPVSAYSSLYFSYSDKSGFKEGVEVKLNVKDQDVGIYKREVLTSDSGGKQEISIPIVCIECKTYLDKTMYEGSVATADKIKSGNPYCLFFIVTETYDISKNVDIETTKIDNIYVLRKQRRPHSKINKNPIYTDVIKHLIEAVKRKMEIITVPVDERITTLGYMRQ